MLICTARQQLFGKRCTSHCCNSDNLFCRIHGFCSRFHSPWVITKHSFVLFGTLVLQTQFITLHSESFHSTVNNPFFSRASSQPVGWFCTAKTKDKAVEGKSSATRSPIFSLNFLSFRCRRYIRVLSGKQGLGISASVSLEMRLIDLLSISVWPGFTTCSRVKLIAVVLQHHTQQYTYNALPLSLRSCGFFYRLAK